MIVNNEQQVNAQAAAAPTAGQPNVEPPVAEQSIEETPTQNVDVQTNTEPRETVIEAPEVDFSNSTDTPPLPENNVEVESPEPQEDPGEPKKTFNYARAYKWVYQLNEQSGGVLSPDEVDAFAQEGLRSDWGRLYRKLGKTLPDNEFLITTYDSFWDVEEGEAEKKNSDESTSTTTSQDAQTTGSMESESEYYGELSSLDIGSFDSKYGFLGPNTNRTLSYYKDTQLSDLILESDLTWMTMSEQEADLAFEREYAKFGFSATQTDVGGNALIIHAPDGTTKQINLYTDERKAVIDWVNHWQTGNTNTGDYRMNIEMDGLRDWMVSKVEDIGLTQLAIRGQQSVEATAFILNQTMIGRSQLTPEDEQIFMELVGGNVYAYEDMFSEYENGSKYFDVNKATEVLNDLWTNIGNQTILTEGQKEARQGQLIKISENIWKRRQIYSNIIGGAIITDPNYGGFDFSNNDYHVDLAFSIGVMPRDISFGEHLTINGKPATFGEAHHLLADYDGVLSVKLRETSIRIDDDVEGEYAKQMLGDLIKLQDRNNAEPLPPYQLTFRTIGQPIDVDGMIRSQMNPTWYDEIFQSMSDYYVHAFDVFGDWIQAGGLAIVDLFGSIIKFASSTPVGPGSIGDYSPDAWNPGDAIKDWVEETRAEYLPYYDSGITDANSFGEVLAKGGQATFESLPISALYMVNPMAGLATTYVSGVGDELYELEKRQEEAQEALDAGYVTESWKIAELEKAAHMTRSEQYAYATLMGGTETAITRVFTYNWFKGMSGAKNFAGVHSAENAAAIANKFGEQFWRGYILNTSKKLGIQPRVVGLEVMEEEAIAMTQYGIEVAWGLREFDQDEWNKLLEETGLQSTFSAVGMGAMGTQVENSRVNNQVNDYMRQNMTTEAEQEILRQFNRAAEDLDMMRKNNEQAEGKNTSLNDGPRTIPTQKYTEAEIKKQEQLLDKLGGQLMTHKNTKDALIADMTAEDKYEFLQAMADVKKHAETVRNDKDANKAAAAVPEMNAAKERARRVLEKYPSSVSFDYMGTEMKSAYMQRAVESLIENEYAGQDVQANYTVTDILDQGNNEVSYAVPTDIETAPGVKQIPTEEIIAKAKELYLMDVAEGKSLGDGTRIVENTTARDAERTREIPREVREGFNVQDHIDQIREKEKSKGITADSDIATETVMEEVPMDKQDRIDELNAERQAAIEQAKNEGSFGQEPVQGKGEGTEIQPPEVTKRIEEINAEYDAKIAQVQGDAKRVIPVNEQGQVDDVSVINENSFTHKTRSKEAIENWANSGQVIGANEDVDAFNAEPNESLLDAQTKDQNRQSPNFQKGKLYGAGTKDVAGGYVIVSKDGAIVDDDVVPNSGFVNQSSLDESNGIGVLNPESRSIDNFDIYSVNEDGSLTKRDWDEFKTAEETSNTDAANNTPRANMEMSREAEALNRIEIINTKADILSYFNNAQKDVIIGFMLDMKNGNKTRVGEVENLLNALDIVFDIQTQLGQNQIDIYSKEGNAAVNFILNNSLDLYSGSLNKLGIDTGTLATTTVLMKSLFKDARIGQAFIDLNNEAGRRVDATKQSNAKRMDEHTALYEQDAKNDPDYKAASRRQRREMRDPNNIANSYEMSILAHLRREMGELDKEGMDVEFARNKSLILQELDIRRADYEAEQERPAGERNPKFEAQYIAFKSVVDKLGIADATSYADVAVRASGRNVQAIQRLVDAQPNAEAMEYLHRYADFDPTQLKTYLPSFYKYSEGQVYVDRIGFQSEMNHTNVAGQTKDATMPTTLVNDANGMTLRLAPGNFWNQAYGSLQGLELDLNARDQYRQISQIMDMPMFQEMFTGNVRTDRGDIRTDAIYDRLATAFKMREEILDKDIRSAHFQAIDIGDVSAAKGVWSSTVQAAYGTASAWVLTGVTQNVRQYQSAVSGVMPLLTSKEARSALTASNTKFYVGMGHATSGVEGRTWSVRQLRNLFGSNDYASNIYAKSRTGMRNSLGSELIVDKNRKAPMSYYLRNFGLVDIKEGATKEEIEAAEQEVFQRFENYGLPVFTPQEMKGFAPELYTIKQFMDAVSRSSNATLELMLANGDRAAANATFEALYIDYRIKQGAKFDKGFWERENANPNIDAINYADQKIDETQKQTTSTSQAGLYSDYSSQAATNLTKFVVPFGSFTFNTRSAIMANMQVLQDPKIDPEQKQQARRFLEGKVREIAYFEGLKTLGIVGLYQGLPGLVQLFGGIDEDDIERYGGLTGIVGDKLIPIEDRSLSEDGDYATGDFVDLTTIKNMAPMEASSVEQLNAINYAVNNALQSFDVNATQAATSLMSFENKFKLDPYNYSIGEKVMNDVFNQLLTTPRPDIANDAIIALWNYGMSAIGAENLQSTEYLTEDLKGIRTKDGLASFIMNNAGIISILSEGYQDMYRAVDLSQRGMLYKRNTMSAQGVTGVAITNVAPEVRERLDQATQTLLYFRLVGAFAPMAPRADFNRLADKMERQLEEIFDALATDQQTFEPKDVELNIKATEEEKEAAAERNSVLDRF